MKHNIKAVVLLITMAFLASACRNKHADKVLPDNFTVTNHLTSQQITSFAEDCRGYIWIGTHRGLNRFNGRTYHQFFNENDSSGLGSNSVNCIMADNKDNLWIGTNNSLNCYRYGRGMTKLSDEFITMFGDTPGNDFVFGNIFNVWRVDKLTFEVSHCHSFGTPEYTNQFVTDNFGKLWTFEGDIIRCIDLPTGKTETMLNTESNITFAVSLGKSIYVATQRGIMSINTASHEMNRVEALSETFGKEKASKLFGYDANSFLILTDSRKLYYFNSKTQTLLRSDNPSFPFDVPKSELQTVFVDSRRNIWIGSKRQGFKTVYNKQTFFNRNYHLTSSFEQRYISSIHVDSKGTLWIIADDKDLYTYRQGEGIVKIDRQFEGSIDQVWSDIGGHIWIRGGVNVYCCDLTKAKLIIKASYQMIPLTGTADAQGNVYVSSLDGKTYRKSAAASLFEPIADKDDFFIIKILCLKNGVVALLDVDKGLYLYDSNKSEVRHYEFAKAIEKTTKFTDFIEDSAGRIWLTSIGDGVYRVDLNGGDVKHYDTNDYCHDVCSIVEDELGHIWIGTFEGLSRLDTTSDRFTTYYREDGIASDEFTAQCVVKTPGKHLIFGGTQGLTSITPEDLLPAQSEHLYLEYLSVDGKLVQDLTVRPEVHLDYDNLGVDFSYTTLGYGVSAPTYQYQMEGFDPGVNTIREADHAYYSHLPVGKYVFRVKVIGGSGDGIEQTVNVTVHPSVWGLPVMRWFVYPLLGLLVIAGIACVWLRQYRHRKRMKAIILEKEQEQRANELNMKFFSNISHEFRTPLTLINGALSMIEADAGDRLHDIMRRNTSRMMRLVNQLMDFNKLENGMLSLCVSETDVGKLIGQIVGLFSATIRKREIDFKLSLPEEPVISLIDRDKFEKVLVNLISNAIKYSNVGDSLTVRMSVTLRDGKQWIKTDVADTGIGVPDDKREAIFGRFYQIEHKRQLPAIGTGVGLYYTRSLVELHHGEILCLGNEPRGSIFTFSLPMDKSFYIDDKKQDDDAFIAEAAGEMEIDETVDLQSAVPDKPVLMVVDDDDDVMNFLQMLLSPHYRTFTYSNATSAYSDIETVKPDLILSDVMMYEVDGYKFCRMIKDNAALCHIPVVLLTAKTSVSEQIEGLDCGASAYVTKPFSPQYLLAVLRSQLEFVKKLQQKLNTSTGLKPAEEKVLQQADSEFMQKLYSYFDEHLSEPELQIEELTGQLGMSRSKFFFKVKSLTGEAANVFFKSYKLNKAAEMILGSNEKLAYIAYMTGFSSPSHFSLNFKKRYGLSPSEYKAKHGG